MSERFIIANRIRTPDGTVLWSKHRHDYVSHKDKNGEEYATDGGDDYLRRIINHIEPYEDLTVYSDDSFEEIREVLYRSGYGKNMDEEFRSVKLSEMSDDWIKNVIEYEQSNRPDNKYLPLYIAEIKYRKEHNIKIDE